MTYKNFTISCFLMGLIIMASNILVAYPVNDWFTRGAITFPICFLITDSVNRFYGAKSARKVVLVGFVVGVVLSIIYADMRIALASGTSFFIAQMLDVAIFDKFRKSTWWKAPIISSALSSLIDTFLFFSIAFYGTGLPWHTWATGDLGAKYLMVVALIPVYRIILVIMNNQKIKEV